MDRKTHTAFHHRDDGATWLRVACRNTGDEWDEPIAGWELIHCIAAPTKSDLGSYYRHKDGRTARMAR